MTVRRTNDKLPAELNQNTQAVAFFRRPFRSAGRKPLLNRFSLVAVGLITTLGLGVPLASASSANVALNIAKYAVATATHDRPQHVASAADVSNAVNTTSSITTNLNLLFNLGDVMGYTRIIDLYDQLTYKNTCVYFPMKIDGTPKIIQCPDRALGEWNNLPGVLGASRAAVSAAASHDRAVAGADVVAADTHVRFTMIPKPTFRAGEGGTVKFGTKVVMGKSTVFTVYICISFPKTAYGIPTQVAC